MLPNETGRPRSLERFAAGPLSCPARRSCLPPEGPVDPGIRSMKARIHLELAGAAIHPRRYAAAVATSTRAGTTAAEIVAAAVKKGDGKGVPPAQSYLPPKARSGSVVPALKGRFRSRSRHHPRRSAAVIATSARAETPPTTLGDEWPGRQEQLHQMRSERRTTPKVGPDPVAR